MDETLCGVDASFLEEARCLAEQLLAGIAVNVNHVKLHNECAFQHPATLVSPDGEVEVDTGLVVELLSDVVIQFKYHDSPLSVGSVIRSGCQNQVVRAYYTKKEAKSQ